MSEPVDLLVIGLGYVGLPLAREAVQAGLSVRGFDVSPRVVRGLNAGTSHIDGVSDEDIAQLRAAGFTATCDEDNFGAPRAVVVCVPTPLDDVGQPDLSKVIGATGMVGRRLRRGMLVVLESTTFPGTTDNIVRPILEESGLRAGEDFGLAFSPERIDPGNGEYGVRNTPKIVGGYTSGCTRRAMEFYSRFVVKVVAAKSTREAEMAKILENTYRQVNIALVNEMAMLSHELGVDLWNAIDCATTKPFGFAPFQPGPGVGGHCIPIDPLYLSYQARMLGWRSQLIDLAQEINDSMPRYVVERAARMLLRHGAELTDSRVLVLGVTYKADISDQRESPADDVVRHLRTHGADVTYHDPYVGHWAVDDVAVPYADDLDAALRTADLTVVLQWHSPYREHVDGSRTRMLFDTRGWLADRDVAVL
ncbi:nucleotide sugar dehydrogenase [Streptomyces sp. SID8352]|uniref:nucleotide sugar dehydrogenase n=1 Tax=Streptomyces sp. SID8352 TaxID=2690338 RepID=UPI00136DA923|nr:nucleotide sugar dehydrogenase [Streptomyces sp. SID8352]MYU23639.1 nucleotide sugar dehydrogenase [Streptomyces sp. SID8352]